MAILLNGKQQPTHEWRRKTQNVAITCAPIYAIPILRDFSIVFYSWVGRMSLAFFIVVFIAFGSVFIALAREKARKQEEETTLRQQRIREEAIRKKEEYRERQQDLTRQYGPETAEVIMAKKIWQGMSADQLLYSWGEPEEKYRSVSKSANNEIWKYNQIGKNRFEKRVSLENEKVKGWSGHIKDDDVTDNPPLGSSEGRRSRKRQFDEERSNNSSDQERSWFFSTIGVAEGAPLSEIKAAYRRALNLVHPDHAQQMDRDTEATATQLTKRLTAAYGDVKKSFK